ncbi:hypothetical protein BST95_01775 [Halioglobus japonicus]|uniref:Uncharacterized protein n=1 Tax=Halioglobus japonicus TaxID=930805 RepID=A0AAP8MC17_9GAMM|nr:SGNH/GDSL hydrolase family protein [Halioglobus japonicus]AQA17132.1 hypothetical protein BST95_01775 [Halioglobus japonicus]PLW85043.1 hypothetical protein C0029_16040 [Halioglobus japonicus]GHD19177.1 hypothetical protein GCM10007052_27320 [Halioglobus japonicus]
MGRFANGPVWTDYLEVSANLALQNLARGGAMAATSEPMSSEELIQRIYTNGQFFVSGHIEDQIDNYATRYLKGGAVQHDAHTVAVLWAGANDYISKEAYDSSISSLLGQSFSEDGYRELVARVVGSLRVHLEHLRSLGLQRFLVINLPHLGKTPMVVHNDRFLVSRDFARGEEQLLEFSSRLHELTVWHNRALAEMVAEFRAESPRAEVEIADVSEWFTRIFDLQIGAAELGFNLAANEVLLGSAGAEGALQDCCYNGMTLGVFATNSTVCKDASRAVFWDLVHPSTYLQCWMAYWLGEQMHSQGWLRPMPEEKAYGAWCAMIADAY